MINSELSVFLLTYVSPNTNITHGIKERLVSFRSFGMYLLFEPKKISLRQSADSQSTKYSVSELMVDLVVHRVWKKKMKAQKSSGIKEKLSFVSSTGSNDRSFFPCTLDSYLQLAPWLSR